MNPTVSAVIPTYNRAEKTRGAIESVLAQTFSDLEVIVVDDGSSDGTGKFLTEFFGNRIRYYAQTNQGPSAARNKGIEQARGEWIAFLDSDDRWEKDKLEWQLKALRQFGPQCGACYTDGRFLNNAETRTLFQGAAERCRHEGTMGVTPNPLELITRQGRGFVIWASALLARADAMRITGGYDPTLRFGEDDEFLFRLATVTGLCYVNLPLVWLDRAPAQERHVGVSAEWDDQEFVLQQCQYRFEKRLRLSEELPWRVRKAVREELSSVHSAWANLYLESGQYEKAREAISKAAQVDLNFNVAVKWLLTEISPKLARRAVRSRQRLNGHGVG
jgi:glycosyltransferase involved in cell wall biosynthesis